MGTKQIRAFNTYEAAATIPSRAAGGVICHISPHPIGQLIQTTMGITRIRLVQETAVLGSYGLVNAASNGIATPAGIHLGQLVSQGNGGWAGPTNIPARVPGSMKTAWTPGNDPTIAGAPIYYELDLLAAAIGEHFEWNWPEENPFGGVNFATSFLSGIGLGVVLQNTGVGASPQVRVSVRWSEFGFQE